LKGKKSNLTRKDFLHYFAVEVLNLQKPVIDTVLQEITAAIPLWYEYIADSFLSDEMKARYAALLEKRVNVLGLEKTEAL